MVRVLTTVVGMAVAVYVTLALLLYVFQSRLIYFPDVGRAITATPAAVGLPFEEVHLDVEHGVRLHGWYVPHAQPRGVALILHGNAGSIALRLDWLAMFHRLGYASLIVDYRGYGASTGTPDEEGTYRDAQAAWRHLVDVRGAKPGEIVVVGESLGGSIAAWLAARVTPRALVIQSTFTSVSDLAAELYPVFPVRWLSRFRYETRLNVAATDAPVLVAHSRDDEIIPYAHGRRLYDAAREPRSFVELRGGHNEGFLFSRPEWTAALAAFLERAESVGAQAEQPGHVLADRHR
jgi:fermentation-respiration switch protein FrsA (DUF1100 family)